MFDLIDKMCANDNCGFGTEINPAFELLARKGKEYDRIFIISDMQVMDGRDYWGWYGSHDSAVKTYHRYFQNTPCYSFDLGGYHTQILSEYDHIRYITALNDQVFKFISLLENSENLASYINGIVYY